MAISPLKETTEFKAKYLPPDRIAIAWRDRRIAWKEINDRTDRLAASLHRLGLSKGETCAFLFYNQPEFIETNLAIQALGAVPVPVNFRYVADELLYVLDNSEAKYFLFHANALPLVQAIRDRLSRVRTLICLGDTPLPAGIIPYETLLSDAPRSYPKADVDPNDTAVIIYTGGTTGRPKGVMLTYQNFRSNQEAIFSFLVQLLPPVSELDQPEYARREIHRKILALVSDLAKSATPVLNAKRDRPPVIRIEIKGDQGMTLPPLTVTLKEGKPKLFVGAPPDHDLLVELRMGEEFRKFLELKHYAHTLRGKMALVPRLLERFRSGGLRMEGSLADRLRMAFANFRKPSGVEQQHIILVPPLFHLASYAFWLTFWLYQDGTVYLPPDPEFQPKDLLDLIERERIGWLLLVPTMWKRCLKTLREEPRKVESVLMALTGAAVMPAKYKREILQFFPNALVVDGFGQTEMAPLTTMKVDADAETVRERSVGTLLEGIEVKIVNEHREEVPDGEVGEILYRSASVMKGYFRDDEKTRQVIDAEGWFHSGDLAFRGEDGEIYTVERKKECINSGGEKIFPQEVEEILLTHPRIEEACVIGVPNEEWGEAVRAVVVPRGDEPLSAEEVIDWCRGKMAGYKKPRSVVFAPSFPVSPVGKILRAKIREMYGTPDATTDTPEQT